MSPSHEQSFTKNKNRLNEDIYSGNKREELQGVYMDVAYDIQPILLLQQVEAAILAGGAQQQHSSQMKNGKTFARKRNYSY